MKRNENLKDFDELPNAAAVDVRTVAALCGCNIATVWERARRGDFPRPRKIGGSTRWNVGELRKVLLGDAE
ncbi:transcriptional regulator, AlpA family [Caballeronia arationis]|uniref:Transcriptional regulator, AlpA family n=1 Tax=Caballeronia arationis TaxID=1777142 RepID=A0A7Z7I9N4_9BURK|nr:transcriptional regulator [Caballeronia arationis]SOE81321.1 transcriptional regulator, AlpA family [Caballeronia arationis]